MKNSTKVKAKKIIRSVLGNNGVKYFQRVYSSLKKKKITESELYYMDLSAKYILKNSTVLDVGANIGLWTQHMSNLVGKSGKVISFEPIQETFSELKKKTSILSNVSLCNFALSDEEGKKTMVLNPSTFADSSAAVMDTADQLTDNSNLKELTIEVKKLDNMNLGEEHSISFMKIDVEGHEMNVLRGGKQLLSQQKPTILIEILREKWTNNEPGNSECAQFLNELGYEINQIQDKRIENQVKQFTTEFENFLFISKN